MKLSVKLDFGSGREFNVGTFSEIGRDSAFEFSGEFLSSGLNPAPFRLSPGTGLKVYDRSGNMDTFGASKFKVDGTKILRADAQCPSK